MNFRRFIEPLDSVTIRHDDSGNWRLHHGPPVTVIGDRWLHQGFRWGDFGYLPVYRDPRFLGWVAVWPLPLWLLHVIGHRCWFLGIRIADRLLRGHLIHIACPENEVAKFRHLRLGGGS